MIPEEVPSLPTRSWEDLSSMEQGTARFMYRKGYRYLVQFRDPEQPTVGYDPLYFKTLGDIGSFMRSYPTIRQSWNLTLTKELVNQ